MPQLFRTSPCFRRAPGRQDQVVVGVEEFDKSNGAERVPFLVEIDDSADLLCRGETAIRVKTRKLKTAVYWWLPTWPHVPKLAVRRLGLERAASSVIVPPRMNMFMARTVRMGFAGLTIKDCQSIRNAFQP